MFQVWAARNQQTNFADRESLGMRKRFGEELESFVLVWFWQQSCWKFKKDENWLFVNNSEMNSSYISCMCFVYTTLFPGQNGMITKLFARNSFIKTTCRFNCKIFNNVIKISISSFFRISIEQLMWFLRRGGSLSSENLLQTSFPPSLRFTRRDCFIASSVRFIHSDLFHHHYRPTWK